MKTLRDKGIFYEASKDKIFFRENTSALTMPYMHFHIMYEIYIVFEGHVRYLLPDKTYELESGSFILLPPYEVHKKISISDTYTILLIEFDESQLLKFFTHEALIDILSPFSDNPHGKIDSASLERLLEIAKIMPTLEDDELFTSMTIAEIIHLLSKQTPLKGQRPVSDKSVDRLVFEYVSKHLEQEITLDTLAAALFMSKQALSARMRSDCNTSVMQYVNQIRLKYAHSMLKYPHFSANTISKYCGFKNQSYFSKIFKDAFGKTPSQFRKEVLRNE